MGEEKVVVLVIEKQCITVSNGELSLFNILHLVHFNPRQVNHTLLV